MDATVSQLQSLQSNQTEYTRITQENKRLIQENQRCHQELAQQVQATHALVLRQSKLELDNRFMLMKLCEASQIPLPFNAAEATTVQELGDNRTASTDIAAAGVAESVLNIAFPSQLKDLDPGAAFCNWYIQGFYRAIGTTLISTKKRANASVYKFAIEYLTLFLDEHVPPLPEGV